MSNNSKQHVLKSMNRVVYSLITCLFASASNADVPNVVTDIAPTHSLVSMIMKGIGTPELLIKPNENPHDYRLRPSKAKALEQADIVFWIASGLTPSLVKTIPNIANSAESVELIKLEGTEILYMRENVAFVEDDHGHGANMTNMMNMMNMTNMTNMMNMMNMTNMTNMMNMMNMRT